MREDKALSLITLFPFRVFSGSSRKIAKRGEHDCLFISHLGIREMQSNTINVSTHAYTRTQIHVDIRICYLHHRHRVKPASKFLKR